MCSAESSNGVRQPPVIISREGEGRVKTISPRQTVCNIPTNDPKDPYCGGKLKRITELDAAAKKSAGPGKDVFRCQKCKTLYVDESPYAVVKGK